jgi:hypothetical protein
MSPIRIFQQKIGLCTRISGFAFNKPEVIIKTVEQKIARE